MSNARNLARLVPNASGQLPPANVQKLLSGNMASGSVVQVLESASSGSGGFSTTSTSYVTWGNAPQQSITLTNPANKVLIIARIGMQYDVDGQIRNTIFRSINGGAAINLDGGNTYGISFHGVAAAGGLWKECTISWVDAPNTTLPVNYRWYANSESGSVVVPEHFGCTTSMQLMEIQA